MFHEALEERCFSLVKPSLRLEFMKLKQFHLLKVLPLGGSEGATGSATKPAARNIDLARELHLLGAWVLLDHLNSGVQEPALGCQRFFSRCHGHWREKGSRMARYSEP